MINMLRKGIKFSMQKVYFRKVIFNVDPVCSFLCDLNPLVIVNHLVYHLLFDLHLYPIYTVTTHAAVS